VSDRARALRGAAVAAMLALVPAGQAGAEALMTPGEFEAHVTGRTLTFAFRGGDYGVEQYLPGRRVLWAFVGRDCEGGVWFPQDGQICFLYDQNPDDPRCWHVYHAPGGSRAVLVEGGVETGFEIVEIKNTATPMACPGAFLGA